MNIPKSILLLFIACAMSLTTYAQKKGKKSKIEKRSGAMLNLENFDNKIIHFGFALGINSANFAVNYDLAQGDSLYKLESKKQSGFNLGIIGDLHLGPYFNLRFIPTLMFSQRNLEYTYLRSNEKFETISKPVESTFILLPIDLKYRSFRKDNYAFYVLGGATFSYDLASQVNTDNTAARPSDIVIKLKKQSYLWQVGVGMDIFLEYFKFSPELKMSYGFDNIIVNDNTIYSNPIESLKTKMLILTFNFEG